MATPTKTLTTVEREWPDQGQWTYQDWLRLPGNGTRYEVINGVLHMTPPPSTSHQSSSNRLANAMTNYVDAQKLGVIYTSPIGVRLPTQPVPLEPDIVFISAAHKEIVHKDYIEGIPDLLVEILSPSNWMYDRNEKFQLYQSTGVPEYWIVDYRAKTVEVFVLEQGEYTLIGKWGVGDSAASRVLEGFQVAAADIFRDIT